MAGKEGKLFGLPWISSNGLQVVSRTSRTVVLAWKQESKAESDTENPTSAIESPPPAPISPRPRAPRVRIRPSSKTNARNVVFDENPHYSSSSQLPKLPAIEHFDASAESLARLLDPSPPRQSRPRMPRPLKSALRKPRPGASSTFLSKKQLPDMEPEPRPVLSRRKRGASRRRSSPSLRFSASNHSRSPDSSRKTNPGGMKEASSILSGPELERKETLALLEAVIRGTPVPGIEYPTLYRPPTPVMVRKREIISLEPSPTTSRSPSPQTQEPTPRPSSRKRRSSRRRSRKHESKSPGPNRDLSLDMKRSKSPGLKRDKSKNPGLKRDKSKSPGLKRDKSKSPGPRRAKSQSPGPKRDKSKSPGSRWDISRTPVAKREATLDMKLDSSSEPKREPSLDRSDLKREMIPAPFMLKKQPIQRPFGPKPAPTPGPSPKQEPAPALSAPKQESRPSLPRLESELSSGPSDIIHEPSLLRREANVSLPDSKQEPRPGLPGPNSDRDSSPTLEYPRERKRKEMPKIKVPGPSRIEPTPPSTAKIRYQGDKPRKSRRRLPVAEPDPSAMLKSIMKMKKYNDDGLYYEVQMKKGLDRSWKTIYKGYADKFEVKDLIPDHNVSFRMRRNGDASWGTPILAATDVAPPNAEDLQRAVQCNCEEMVLRILGGCKGPRLKLLLQTQDRAGHTPLMLTSIAGNYEMMNTLINAGARVNDVSPNTGKTALMLSIFQGNFKCVQLLDRNGADWTAVDRAGCNCLHHAVTGGHVKLLPFVLEKFTAEHIDDKDHAGWTPLLRAAVLGMPVEIMKCLIMKGANPNAMDPTKSKSVLIAATMTGKIELVNFLLDHLANPNFENCHGQTALTIADGMKLKDVVASLTKRLAVKAPNEVKKAYNPRDMRGRFEEAYNMISAKRTFLPKPALIGDGGRDRGRDKKTI